MRQRSAAAVLLVVFFAAACAPTEAPLEAPTSPPRPTPSGPTPTLPLAKPIASPSPSAAVALGQPTAGPAFQTFALQSTAFADGGTLPTDFTCDGVDQSPPLAWSGAPPGTAAYALIEQDDDNKVDNTPFTQWLLYNMPRGVTQLNAGVPAKPLLTNGSQQGLNGNQTVGYLGPCPKKGDPPHHITFQLFAQDGYVTIETGASLQAVNDALNGHTIGQTQLTVICGR
jgi:Raf kinase inhibitor-like YbhB/YbcL family protein